MRIGIIGGAGWLGGNLARAALSTAAFGPSEIAISSRREHPPGFESWPDLQTYTDSTQLVQDCDAVVLAVRRPDYEELEITAAGKLLISVMAVVSESELSARFPDARIVRSMPNACAEVRMSYTPLFSTYGVTESDRFLIERFFAASGTTQWVEHERTLDYLTVLTGCGPVFVAAFCNALVKHAISSGVPPELAEAAVKQLVKGSGAMISAANETTAQTVESVVAYGGVASVGIQSAIAANLARPIEAGLDAALSALNC